MSAAQLQGTDCIIVGAGIDWLTCSSTNPETKRKMHHAFGQIALDDCREGYGVVPSGFHGFAGHKVRHASLLHRADRTLYIASGRRAQRGLMLARAGDNCSRIDVQVTFTVPGGDVARWINACHLRVRNSRTLRGKPQRTELRVIDGGAQTLYVGRRSSDVYVRIYDKFEESHEECYRGCVRYEIEYKGKRSQAIWNAIADGTLSGMGLLSLLLKDLSERGIDTSMIDLERQDIRLPKAKPSKESVTWGWWASQVAPSVARSVAERGWYTAFSILFKGALTEFDKTAIMNSLSVCWGN